MPRLRETQSQRIARGFRTAGATIEKRIRISGDTPVDAAAKVGVSMQTVYSRFKKAEKTPLGELVKYCMKYDISLEELFEGLPVKVRRQKD